MNKILYLLPLMLLASCTGGQDAKIKGTFCGAEGKTVYLERVAVGGTKVLDSATTNRAGDFKFGVQLSSVEPSFYNLRCNGQVITLLLTQGESVKVKAIGNIARNYEVEGSEGSNQVRELNTLIVTTSQKLDSLTTIYRTTEDVSTLKNVTSEIRNVFVNQKRNSIKFLVSHPNSMASLMALYQRLPGGVPVFGDDGDAIYYQMIADSLIGKFPASPHVIALLRDVKGINSAAGMTEVLNSDAIRQVDFPELEMNDMYGQKHKLSALAGNVILLDFWTSQIPELKANNAELMEIYNQYKDSGFQIYQIALDLSKPVWINAVQQQGLPWISVCDFMGPDSYAVKLYNIKHIPSNYLIDQHGNIIAKDLYGEKLAAKLGEIL